MNQRKKSLLEQLYCGEFFPCENIRPTDPEYLPSRREAAKEDQWLRKRLGEEDLKHYERLYELSMDENYMNDCASFIYGFRYGALLMLEIMTGQDSPSV